MGSRDEMGTQVHQVKWDRRVLQVRMESRVLRETRGKMASDQLGERDHEDQQVTLALRV